MHRHFFTNATLATLRGDRGYGLIERGGIAVDAGRIVYVGRVEDVPTPFSEFATTSLEGRLVTPGLIDCHTHLIHAGSRAHDFEQRQEGASYEEIARSGGGIFSTVEATRNATDRELLETALTRLDRMLSDGVTTVEVKSGYGLDRETELRMLRVADQLSKMRKVRIVKTFLGAHAVPRGMDANTYLSEICLPTLQSAAQEGLVDMVDGFCETIAFAPEQIEKVFVAARQLGLPIKLHAEQLSDQKGAVLAAKYGAISADHLEYIGQDGIGAMAAAGVTAVLLPGAFYFLRETKVPPVEGFREAGVPMAIATDCNPGSSPMTSLLLAMNMAATLFGLTASECLRGVTVNGARALGIPDIGALDIGQHADLAVWDTADPADLTYRIGDAPLHQRIFEGMAC